MNENSSSVWLGPGSATDKLVRRAIESRERRDGFTVIRSSEAPGYWFANCLLLDEEPTPSSYDTWLAECARCFADDKIERLVVTWEVPRLEGLAQYAGPVVRDCSTIFTSRKAPRFETPFMPRMFVSACDWSAALELMTQHLVADGLEHQVDFEAWRFGLYRRDAAAGRCRFWGLWLDGRLAAYAGLYFDADWTRFVTPVTRIGWMPRSKRSC